VPPDDIEPLLPIEPEELLPELPELPIEPDESLDFDGSLALDEPVDPLCEDDPELPDDPDAPAEEPDDPDPVEPVLDWAPAGNATSRLAIPSPAMIPLPFFMWFSPSAP
jgi:hypothetical protein